ncbi:MAG: hypothetical protein M1820_000199 [Bogoriella megaspora]|nr:MAG: hypothetical protein M1820_000199 [Bogoriella megaspora]
MSQEDEDIQMTGDYQEPSSRPSFLPNTAGISSSCAKKLRSDGTLSSQLTEIVASSGQVFTVHKDLLCYYSPNFRAALNGHFREKSEGKLDLSDVDDRIVNVFLEWLYFERLPWDLSNDDFCEDESQKGGSSENEDYEDKTDSGFDTGLKEELAALAADDDGESGLQLQAGVDRRDANDLISIGENPDVEATMITEADVQLRKARLPDYEAYLAAQPEAELVETYILADKYDIPELRNDLMTRLWFSEQIFYPDELYSWAVVVQAFENLPANSGLCRYLIDLYSRHYDASLQMYTPEEKYFEERLSNEFLVPVMQCLSQKDRAAKEPLCEYHEHADGDGCDALRRHRKLCR